MIPNATEQKTIASHASTLSSVDDSANPQVDGNQGTQQYARRSGDKKQLQQIEGEDKEAVRLKVWPCGCDEAPRPYIENFATFQRHVRDGLKNLKSQDVHYDRIEALMVYWKGSDVPKVAENAKELGNLLGEAPYNFTVTPHEIDYRSLSQDKIDDNFRDALRTVEDRLRAQNKETSSLFILYYGGHGVVDRADHLWKPTKSSGKSLFWSNYQSQMYGLNCDILYLFDCCYSLAMVETPLTKSHHRRRCEILCSSGLKEPSGAQNRTLFTEALVKLLKKKRVDILDGKAAIGGLTFADICFTMTGQEIRNDLIAEPRWQVVAPNPAFRGKITLAKKGVEIETITPHAPGDDSDSGYESQKGSRSQLSNARILIKIRLRDPAEALSSDDWLKWFEDRPHNVAHVDIAVVKKIEWVGVFESDSSLALITVPMWLWHSMEQDPACESLGLVRSKNLLRRPPDEIASVVSANVDAHADKTKEREQDRSLRNVPLDPRDIAKSAKPTPVEEPVKRKPRIWGHLRNTSDPPIQANTAIGTTKRRGKTSVTVSMPWPNSDFVHKQLAILLPDSVTGPVINRAIRPLVE